MPTAHLDFVGKLIRPINARDVPMKSDSALAVDMFSAYRPSQSVASFSSAETNFEPNLSTHSLGWTPTQSGGSFPGHVMSNDDSWGSNPAPTVDTFPKRSVNGIVVVHQFTPAQGEPKTRITVNIAFRQLPGRLIGLRIVLGGTGLKTQVANANRRGQWHLRAEIPSDHPVLGSPSCQMIKIEALEGEAVIDSVDVGNFNLWETGTLPASMQTHSSLSRRVRSFDNSRSENVPHISRSSNHPYRTTSIASTLASNVSASSLTSAPLSMSPSTQTSMRQTPGASDGYRIVRRTEIPSEREAAAVSVTMTMHGDVRELTNEWTPEEQSSKRRLVQFWRHIDGHVVNVHFCVITPEEYDDTRIVVSCIYREDAGKCYITSFDLIRLLEGIIGSSCNIDEKNRIRRNVHHIEHDTISKSKPYHEDFFDLIMSFQAPMPRRNVRDLKAFRWEFLPDALHAIMDKMALDYDPKSMNEMIEPSIPELPEPVDASIPSFSRSYQTEPERRDSLLSADPSFSFRRPSCATQSVLSFDTVSPNSSVASFHPSTSQAHISPSTSLANFHINASPSASVSSFNLHPNSPMVSLPQGQSSTSALPTFQAHHQPSPDPTASGFGSHLSAGTGSQPFTGQNYSPSPDMANFQMPATSSPNLGIMQQSSMDMSGVSQYQQHSTHETPTGSFSNLDTNSASYGNQSYYTQTQPNQLRPQASHSSLNGAMHNYYMTS